MSSSSSCPHGGEIVIDDEIDAKIDDTEFDFGRCGPTDADSRHPLRVGAAVRGAQVAGPQEQVVGRHGQAAMTMYLVHVAIVLWLSVAFIRVSWPAELEIALIIVLSAASYAFDCVVQSSSVLTFLFNGTWEVRGGVTASIAPRNISAKVLEVTRRMGG